MRFQLLIVFLLFTFLGYSQQKNNLVVDSLIKEANTYTKQNHQNFALKCYLQATKLVDKNSPQYKKLHLEFGQFYFDWGLYDKAIQNILLGGSFQTVTEENYKIIKLLALSYEKIKKYDMALLYYKELYNRYNDPTNLKTKASLLVLIANVYKKTGQYNNSTSYELENLKIRRQLNDSVGVFIALNNLGSSYKELKEYQKSLECLTQSMTLNKQLGEDKQMGITLMNIGLIYQYLNNQELALKNMLSALQIFQKYKKYYEISQVSNAIGAIYYNLEEYNNSKKYTLNSLSNAKISKTLESQAESYKLLSKIYKAKGLIDDALKYLQKHAEIKDSILFKQMTKEHELSQKY